MISCVSYSKGLYLSFWYFWIINSEGISHFLPFSVHQPKHVNFMREVQINESTELHLVSRVLL